MLVVCGGLQRTGSTVMWQMMGDIVLLHGGFVPTLNQSIHYWAKLWANSGILVLAKSHFYRSTFTSVLDKIKVVMTVRDPRDVVVSLSHFLDTTPECILHGRSFEAICRNRRDWLVNIPPDQLLIIKYEDFRTMPEATILSITDFLELPISTGHVTDIKDKWTLTNNKARVKRKLHVQEREYVSTRQIYSGEVDQWHVGWTLDEIELTEEMAANWMEYHNYIPYDNPAEDE